MTPRVVVLAAPSGGGKTTIARELRTRLPDVVGYSVSATTRTARPGERDGEAYHFLTRDEFLRRLQAGEFLERAEYAGELYGTLRSEVERVLRSGRNVVLDVEVQGARQVRRAYPPPASVVIFIIPPSARVLIERLRKRRTETEAQLRRRIDIDPDPVVEVLPLRSEDRCHHGAVSRGGYRRAAEARPAARPGIMPGEQGRSRQHVGMGVGLDRGDQRDIAGDRHGA